MSFESDLFSIMGLVMPNDGKLVDHSWLNTGDVFSPIPVREPMINQLARQWHQEGDTPNGSYQSVVPNTVIDTTQYDPFGFRPIDRLPAEEIVREVKAAMQRGASERQIVAYLQTVPPEFLKQAAGAIRTAMADFGLRGKVFAEVGNLYATCEQAATDIKKGSSQAPYLVQMDKCAGCKLRQAYNDPQTGEPKSRCGLIGKDLVAEVNYSEDMLGAILDQRIAYAELTTAQSVHIAKQNLPIKDRVRLAVNTKAEGKPVNTGLNPFGMVGISTPTTSDHKISKYQYADAKTAKRLNNVVKALVAGAKVAAVKESLQKVADTAAVNDIMAKAMRVVASDYVMTEEGTLAKKATYDVPTTDVAVAQAKLSQFSGIPLPSVQQTDWGKTAGQDTKKVRLASQALNQGASVDRIEASLGKYSVDMRRSMVEAAIAGAEKVTIEQFAGCSDPRVANATLTASEKCQGCVYNQVVSCALNQRPFKAEFTEAAPKTDLAKDHIDYYAAFANSSKISDAMNYNIFAPDQAAPEPYTDVDMDGGIYL